MNYYVATAESPYSISCGGLVYRSTKSGYEFALLTRADDVFPWHLPKGMLERDERPDDAARREVAEESGLIGKIQTYLGTATYKLPKEVIGYPFEKTVLYFLLKYEQPNPDGMDGEYDRLEWFDAKTAAAKLKGSYKNEGEVLRRGLEWLKRHGG